MKKHSMPEMKEGGVNVTPLIDIVMCLIIFFMLVAKIGVTRGEDKDIRLPEAILGARIEDLGNSLTLNIHSSPRPEDDPQVTALINNEKKDIHGDELVRVLKAFKAVHTDKTKVILRGDQELLYMQLEKVLVALHLAEISDTAYEMKQVHEYTGSSGGTPAADAPAAQ